MRETAMTVAVALRTLISLLRNVTTALLRFLFPFWYEPDRIYRPERHYMRGPGPKWREKYPTDRASSGGV
jgi:hypothetical protein